MYWIVNNKPAAWLQALVDEHYAALEEQEQQLWSGNYNTVFTPAEQARNRVSELNIPDELKRQVYDEIL